jgi:nucleoid-associated protein YgaU
VHRPLYVAKKLILQPLLAWISLHPKRAFHHQAGWMGEMTKPISTSTAIALLAAIAIVGFATAQAKQQCSVAAGHSGYWSWRMIDNRKCWYEGKPMLSKDLLEWAPAAAGANADSTEADAAPAAAAPAKAAPASAAPAMRHAPMDARAQAPDDSGTFEAMWRSRIGY